MLNTLYKIPKNYYKYLKRLPPIFIILFRLAFYFNYPEFGKMYPDSASYINYDFSQGLRMPFYPFIIWICKMLLGEKYFIAGVVWLQIIISAVAVFWFYRALYLATNNRMISSIAVIFYGCNNSILYWDLSILTESLSIAVSAAFLYSLVRFVKFGSFKEGSIAILISLLAAGIKPVLAVYTGICLILLVLRFFIVKQNRRIIAQLMPVLFAVILIYGVYSYMNLIYHGTFNLTVLGPRHSVVPCLVTGSYHNYPDEELVAEIEKICIEEVGQKEGLGTWDASYSVMKLFGTTEKEQNRNANMFSSYCNRSDLRAYIMYLVTNIGSNWNSKYSRADFLHYFQYSNIFVEFILLLQIDMSIFDVGSCFYMIAFSLLISIYKCFKEEKCPWFYLGVWGVLVAIIGSNFLGSYTDFSRLTIYAFPFLYFGYGLIGNDIYDKCHPSGTQVADPI